MTYHSEPITRRYIGHIKESQIKNQRGLSQPMKEKEAKNFSERWEVFSLESSSLVEKSRYFSTGARVLGTLTWAMLILGFLLIKLVFGFGLQWGAAIGYMFLPFALFCAVWVAFEWRAKRSKQIKNYFSPFTSNDLAMAAVLGVAGTVLIVLILALVMTPAGEVYR